MSNVWPRHPAAFSKVCSLVGSITTLLWGLGVATAQGAGPASPNPIAVPWTLPVLLQRVPPLKNDATGRYPMVCWDPFKLTEEDMSFYDAKPLPPAMIRELARRGLTQWIPVKEKYIPYALALQKEGAGVIMVEGDALNGPGGLGPDPLHHLPADFKGKPHPPGQQQAYACPLVKEGWRLRSEDLRQMFLKYKAAGVKLDAVWLDWEIEPYAGKPQWAEAKACSRCRQMFPPGVLDDFERYRAFITLLRSELFSAYIVPPILEAYPGCSVTNWETVISSQQHPTPRWSGSTTVPPGGLGMFTAANPVAYGNTAWYGKNWKKEWGWPLDEAHMDRLYTQVMLGQISGNERNAALAAPEKQAIPWVARFCPDDPDEKIPILSRPRYREILRHCWLRGADGMQIFCHNWYPARPERVAIVTEEVEDAVQICDEMLAHRPFLERGIVMNTDEPQAPDDGPLWSGLRLDGQALVRTFTQGPKTVSLTLTPFPAKGGNGPAVTLDCPPAGATYLLTHEGDAVRVALQ